ncbi:MAG: hypothetical protein ACPGN3_08420 [Opitutales bacterium]
MSSSYDSQIQNAFSVHTLSPDQRSLICRPTAGEYSFITNDRPERALKSFYEDAGIRELKDLEPRLKEYRARYRQESANIASYKIQRRVGNFLVDVGTSLPLADEAGVGLAGVFLKEGINLAYDGLEYAATKEQEDIWKLINPDALTDDLVRFSNTDSAEERITLQNLVLKKTITDSEEFKELNDDHRDRLLFWAARATSERIDNIEEERLKAQAKTDKSIKEINTRIEIIDEGVELLSEKYSSLKDSQLEIINTLGKHSDRIAENALNIEENARAITENRADIETNKNRIDHNRNLILGNSQSIGVLKSGLYSLLPNKKKFEWASSGFYKLDTKAFEQLKEDIRVDKIKAYSTKVSEYLGIANETTKLLGNLGIIKGELAEDIGKGLKYAGIANTLVTGALTGFSNPVAMLSAVNSLFGGTDAATKRHSQLVNMISYNTKLLKQVLRNQAKIMKALQVISRQLKGIEEKMDSYQRQLMEELFYIRTQIDISNRSIGQLLGGDLSTAIAFINEVSPAADYFDLRVRWATVADAYNQGLVELQKKTNPLSISERDNWFYMDSFGNLDSGSRGIITETQGTYSSRILPVFLEASPTEESFLLLQNPPTSYEDLQNFEAQILPRVPDSIDSDRTTIQKRLLRGYSVITFATIVRKYTLYRVFHDGDSFRRKPSEMNDRDEILHIAAINRNQLELLEYAFDLINESIAQETLIAGIGIQDKLIEDLSSSVVFDLISILRKLDLPYLEHNLLVIFILKRLETKGHSSASYAFAYNITQEPFRVLPSYLEDENGNTEGEITFFAEDMKDDEGNITRPAGWHLILKKEEELLYLKLPTPSEITHATLKYSPWIEALQIERLNIARCIQSLDMSLNTPPSQSVNERLFSLLSIAQ